MNLNIESKAQKNIMVDVATVAQAAHIYLMEVCNLTDEEAKEMIEFSVGLGLLTESQMQEYNEKQKAMILDVAKKLGIDNPWEYDFSI